jgi:hypothetical protein
MNRLILILVFNCIAISLSYCNSNEFTINKINEYINKAVERYKFFYDDISALVSDLPYEIKSEQISIILDHFEKYDELIKNDMQILGMSTETYSIKDYLQTISTTNGNENEFFIEVEVKQQPEKQLGLYKDSKSDNYSVFIYYVRTVSKNKILESEEKGEKNDKPIIDVKNMIMEVYTKDFKKFGIKRFAEVEGSFDPKKNGYIQVQPVQVTENIPKNSAFFVFDIRPYNSKLFINDVEIDYINGEKIPTSLGQHKIVVTSPNHKNYEYTANVREIGQKDVSIVLQKASGKLSLIPSTDCTIGATVRLFNTLDFSSTQEASKSKAEIKQMVKLNKAPIYEGKLGLYNQTLDVGTYKYEVSKNGFKKIESIISILNDKTTSVNIGLIERNSEFISGAANILGAMLLTETSCGACDNTGKCSKCDGSGVTTCKCCGGLALISDSINSKFCSSCNGTGKIVCSKCEGSKKCTTCKGKGKK